MIEKRPSSSEQELHRAPRDSELLDLLFQGKWRIPVVRELLNGPRRLLELKQPIPHSTKKALRDTLYALERLGWVVHRHGGAEITGVEYSIKSEIRNQLDQILGRF